METSSTILPICLLLLVMAVGTACNESSQGAEDSQDVSSTVDVGRDADITLDAEFDGDVTGDMSADLAVGPPIDEARFPIPSTIIPRLTRAQVKNTIHSIFGPSVIVPRLSDPDLKVSGFLTIGSGISTMSPRGTESIESMAIEVARQIVSAENRGRYFECDPSVRTCLDTLISTYGRRLWRRPLTTDEKDRLNTLFELVENRLQDPWAGLEFVFSAFLQSPHFHFRKSIGINGRYTDYEMASRLSFLLWNTTPDDALLDAAEAQDLSNDQALRVHLDRLLESPKVRPGLLRLFSQWFNLNELDALNKDPSTFTALSADLGQLAHRETLMGLEELVFDDNGDFRDLLTRETTYVDRKLASIYGVRAPEREGFGKVSLNRSTGRRGLLGQISFLALNAHPVSTSATLRGKFIREKLLCNTIPPPPADVDTSIPEPSGRRQTLRARIDEHLTNEACSSCHLMTDPIGLAYENFDGIGLWRDLDHGAIIDASGDLDGEPFADAWQLAGLLRSRSDFARCVTINVFRFVTGTVESLEQSELIRAMTTRFVRSGHRLLPLIGDLIMSRAFRELSPVMEDGQ